MLPKGFSRSKELGNWLLFTWVRFASEPSASGNSIICWSSEHIDSAKFPIHALRNIECEGECSHTRSLRRHAGHDI